MNLMFVKKSIMLPIYSLILYFLKKYNSFTIKKFGLFNGVKYLHLINRNNTNELFKEKDLSSLPLMICRYGSVEFSAITTGNNIDPLCNNAGFFPRDKKLISKFKDVYLEASKSIDILYVWNYNLNKLTSMSKKKSLIRNFSNIKYIIELHTLDPYHNNWISELKGKKLLILHPFKKSIEYQINKNNTLLPVVKSIDIIEAVQTIAGHVDTRFKDWFEALDFMIKEIQMHEFDVCLIGCGAYGLPLAAAVKKMVKQAIHIGGPLQLLFKIKGKRWVNRDDYEFDKSWISPLTEDIPSQASKVEDACYW